MREWSFVSAPIIIVLHFVIWPSHFSALVNWAEHLLH